MVLRERRVIDGVCKHRTRRFDVNDLAGPACQRRRTNIMRTNAAGCVLAFLVAVVLCGCSGGPNLMFWKRSPFQTSHVGSPPSVGSPQKPSALAAKGGGPSNKGAADAPTWTPPNATAGTTPPNVNVPQTPYPTTTPGNVPLTAGTAGIPGAGAYGNPPPAANSYPGSGTNLPSANSPYGVTNPYAQPDAAAPRYDAPPTTGAMPSYGGAPPATNPSYGNPPSYGASPYDAKQPGSSGTESAAPADRYSAPTDRYSTGGGAPLVGNRWSSPGATPPTAGSGAYNPPPSNPSGGSPYDPPSVNVPAVPDAGPYGAPPSQPEMPSPSGGFYAPPANSYSPGAASSSSGGTSEPQPYRPGGTSDYVPRN
jgi:hypothetical protein